MDSEQNQALTEMKHILGVEYVKTDPAFLDKETENTLDIKRQISGILYPSTTSEVQNIVKIANKYHSLLYPVSAGKNVGYGEKVPVSDGHVIVDLRRMNVIRQFNDVLGYVIVEPGVSQIQLYEYLKKHHARYWMDATGAGMESSIIGNSLEGGFGHTPKGNRREVISDLEIVLGNGTILHTGTFPNLGPDLKGLFIQSNFGIVTSAKMELFPIPERFESFVVSIKNDSGLEPLVDALHELRQNNTITSLVHVANATRSFMTMEKCPGEFMSTVLSCERAQQLLSSPVLKIGYWSAIGGIYGTGAEVKSHKKEIQKELKKVGKITFYNDSKLRMIDSLFNNRFVKKTLWGAKIRKSIGSYKSVYGLMKGIPSDEALNNIQWRVDSYEHMGLIWYSPTVFGTGKEVRRAVHIAECLFSKFRFEMPVTITFITQNQVVIVLSISFNKRDPDKKKRAYELYDELHKEFSRSGIKTYREGILGMHDLIYNQNGKHETLSLLKKAFDPNGIIAPGRYGI